MILKRLASFGLVVALALGVVVGTAGGASAGTANLERAGGSPAPAEQSVVLSLGGDQILLSAADLEGLLAEFNAPMSRDVGASLEMSPMQTLVARAMWVNPITAIKCVAEIASFIFGSAGKLAYIAAKIMKVVNKSAKLKAALKKVGGIKAALKGLWDKLKHKKMTAKHRADVDGFWKGLAKQAGSIAGIGNCLSLF